MNNNNIVIIIIGVLIISTCELMLILIPISYSSSILNIKCERWKVQGSLPVKNHIRRYIIIPSCAFNTIYNWLITIPPVISWIWKWHDFATILVAWSLSSISKTDITCCKINLWMKWIVINCIDSYRRISNIHMNLLVLNWILWKSILHRLTAAPSTYINVNNPVWADV